MLWCRFAHNLSATCGSLVAVVFPHQVWWYLIKFERWNPLSGVALVSENPCNHMWKHLCVCDFDTVHFGRECAFLFILFFFFKLHSLILFTHKAYVMYVYGWPSALRFGGWSGNIHATQVKWVALRCSLYRERWAVLAQLLCYIRWSWQRWSSVFSHRYSVLQRWEKNTQKAAVGMEK